MISVTRRGSTGALVLLALGLCGVPGSAGAFEELVEGSLVVCRQVADNEKYGCSKHFGSNIDDVFAWMVVRVPEGRTGRITAVWTRNGEVVQRTPYGDVRFSPNGWRTQFRQRITSTMTGRWQVTVLDRNGIEIGRQEFTIGHSFSVSDAGVSDDAAAPPDAARPLPVPDPNRSCPVAIPRGLRRLSLRDPQWTLCTSPDEVSRLSADPQCAGSATLDWPLLVRRDGAWSGASMAGCAGGDGHCALLRPAEAWRAGAPLRVADGDVCLSPLLVKGLDVNVPPAQRVTCGENVEFDRALARCAARLFEDRSVQDHGLVEFAWRLVQPHDDGRALIELPTTSGRTVTLGHGSERVVGRVLIEAGSVVLFAADISSRPQLDGMPDPEALVRALRSIDRTTTLRPDRDYFHWTLESSRTERAMAPTIDEDTPVDGIVELFPVEEFHESIEYIERIRVPLDLRWSRSAADVGVPDASPDATFSDGEPPGGPVRRFDVVAIVGHENLRAVTLAAGAIVFALVILSAVRRRARRVGESRQNDVASPSSDLLPGPGPQRPVSPVESDSHPLEELSQFIQRFGDAWGGGADRPAELVRSAFADTNYPELESSHYELCKSFEHIYDEVRAQRWRSPPGRARGLLAEWAEIMVNLLGGFEYEIERCGIGGTKFGLARRRLLQHWTGESPPAHSLNERQQSLDLLWTIIERAADRMGLEQPERIAPYDPATDIERAVDPSARTFEVTRTTYRRLMVATDAPAPAPVSRIARLSFDGSPHHVKRLAEG